MNWSSLFADLLKVIETVAPLAEMEEPQAAAIIGAVGTIATTLANKVATAPVTTTVTTTTKPAA